MAATHRVTINLESEEFERLAALSTANRVSLAWLGRQAVIEFLANLGNGQLALPITLDAGQTGKS